MHEPTTRPTLAIAIPPSLLPYSSFHSAWVAISPCRLLPWEKKETDILIHTDGFSPPLDKMTRHACVRWEVRAFIFNVPFLDLEVWATLDI